VKVFLSIYISSANETHLNVEFWTPRRVAKIYCDRETAHLADPSSYSLGRRANRRKNAMSTPAWVETLGDIAGFCTTFAFVPQLVRIYRQGGRDLSYGMLSFYLGGVLMWLGYGILIHAQAVALTNAATAVLIAAATVLKAWKERQPVAKRMVGSQLPEEG
jgi:MtN3 and saliva related transmembrane protein